MNNNDTLSPPRTSGQASTAAPSPPSSFPPPSPNPTASTDGRPTHYPPSPNIRPGFEERSSSKPALRIRRASRLEDSPVPSDLTEADSSAAAGGRRWSRFLPSGASPRVPAAQAPSPSVPPSSVAAPPLRVVDLGPPGTVSRGGPLTPVPEITVSTPAGSTHAARGGSSGAPTPLNPSPGTSAAVAAAATATQRDLPAPVTAPTEEKQKKGLAKLWPFGRGKKDPEQQQQQRNEQRTPVVPSEAGTNAQDYASVDQQQYGEDVVDWLDVIDPEVATVSTLSNVQNSLFLPDLGGLYNRTPIINLNLAERRRARRASASRPRRTRMQHEEPHVSAFDPADEVRVQEDARRREDEREQQRTAERRAAERVQRESERRERDEDDTAEPPTPSWGSPELGGPTGSLAPRRRRSRSWSSSSSSSSSSGDSAVSLESAPEVERGREAAVGKTKKEMSEEEKEMRRRERLMRSQSTIRGEYAILPAGIAWDSWTEEEKAELDDHVRHLMHSRRERIRRRMRGFWQFVRQPVGFFITLYAFLITFWGTAWVLFLIGWISVGGRQKYFIEIADQILTALFCVVGIGLAPFRAVDTYHMIYIAHYHRLTWRLRRERNLPKLDDKNDLPAPQALDPDLEAQFQKEREAPVLTEEQQRKLTYHQMKYHRSHTFYRPHETPTHRAFPLDLLIVITCLLDAHSMLQMALGGTTWGIYYKNRPAALTATILSCSLSCNITAGIIISVGTRRTRKKEEVEKRLRQALTEEAMHRIEKRERREREVKEAQARGELPPPDGLGESLSRRVEKVAETLGREKSRQSDDSDRDPLAPKGKDRSQQSLSGKAKGPYGNRDEANTSGPSLEDSPDVAEKMTVPR